MPLSGKLEILLFGFFVLHISGREFYENWRTLQTEVEFFRDFAEDFRQQASSDLTHRGKKRKREHEIDLWAKDADQMLDKVESDLVQVKKPRYFLLPSEMRNTVQKDFEALTALREKGQMLLTRDSDGGGQAPACCAPFPVKDLIGRVASDRLEKLRCLLLNPKVGRIAIHGKKGLGKTHLMKHLHNWALKLVKKFEYVLWVTLLDHVSIINVQDDVARAVNVSLSGMDGFMKRAEKLSRALKDLGSFVLFLDGVPEAFPLKQVGIPSPTEATSCKLVLTTESPSACRAFECAGEVELLPFDEEDAYELFTHDALLDEGSISSLDGIPYELAKACRGIPHEIEEEAVSMRGIHDVCEWRNKLFERSNIAFKGEKQSMLVSTNKLEHGSKRLKKVVSRTSSFIYAS